MKAEDEAREFCQDAKEAVATKRRRRPCGRLPPSLQQKQIVAHEEIIRKFQDKSLARQLNQMLVNIEYYDPERYRQAEDFITWLYEHVHTEEKKQQPRIKSLSFPMLCIGTNIISQNEGGKDAHHLHQSGMSAGI